MCDLDPKVKAIGKKAGICDGVPSTVALVDNFNNTGVQMLYSIYHMSDARKIKLHFWHENLRFSHLYATLLWASFHNVTKICNLIVDY